MINLRIDMDGYNFQDVKQVVEQVAFNEAQSIDILRSLLSKENESLNNPILERVDTILGKWCTTPLDGTLKELEEFR